MWALRGSGRHRRTSGRATVGATRADRSASSGQTSIFTRMTALAERTGAVNLGQGFPDFDGPAAVEAAVAALRAGHNQYAPLPGVPALRRAVAEHQRRRYGIELDPDSEIQVTFGATEALASALLALLEPGDEVAFLDPTYDSYPAVAALAGAAARPIVLEPPDWRLRARGGRGGDRPAHAGAAAELAPQPDRPRARRRRARAARRRVPRARRRSR